jgi:hypothetical protein
VVQRKGAESQGCREGSEARTEKCIGIRAAFQGHPIVENEAALEPGNGKCESQGEACERLECDENCGGKALLI